MNSLWVRLTLAFIGVTLVTVIVVAALADATANREFRRYVEQRDQLQGRPAMQGGQIQNPPGGGGRPPQRPVNPGRPQPVNLALALEDEFAFRLRVVLVVTVLIVGVIALRRKPGFWSLMLGVFAGVSASGVLNTGLQALW